jgi:addiction module RelE/StbE family toxin
VIIKYSKRFKKTYNRLPQKIKEQVKQRTSLWTTDPQNPQLHVHRLKADMHEYKTFNVSGDLRIKYHEEADGVFIFDDIGTHSQLY